VRYFLERGRVYNSSGNKKKAWSQFLSSYELAKKVSAEYLLVDAAHMLSIARADFEEQKKWTLLALKRVEVSKDPKVKKWKGSLLNNWGWTLFDNKKYNEALKVFNEALEFRKAGGDPRSTHIAYWSVARTYRALGKLDRAFQIQKKLYDSGKKRGSQSGFVLEELAEIYLAQGDKDKSKKFFLDAYNHFKNDKWMMNQNKKRIKRIKKLAGLPE
jgi:tetratricopeptide (TPR) repeat protein